MFKQRCFFAGSNSGSGFFSFFEHIIGADTQRVFLLKGGPGSGKSRFMSEIADVLGKKGHEIELFYCSSDPESLDAVAIPSLQVALIDATKPHVVEMEWPGCRDELICLSNFWSTAGLRESKKAIFTQEKRKQEYFATAFNYLEAARLIEENRMICHGVSEAVFAKIKKEIFATLEDACDRSSLGGGHQRKLFASAFTPKGYTSHLAGLIAGYRLVYILNGALTSEQTHFLSLLVDYAVILGYETEVFYYPLDPRKILHVLVPQLSLAIVSGCELDLLDTESGAFIEVETGSGWPSGDVHKCLFDRLLKLATQSLSMAQQTHGVIETYYRAQMDFALVDVCRERVLAEILGL